MTQQLEEILGELGIPQYLDAFVDQGFDTWDTILDITESDLDALGVKLGHRRKLQRRIANSRGLAPEASLVSPTQPSIEDTRIEASRPDASILESRNAAQVGVIAKRKYRRHPKPDENAPERPPSAYVLFSNKMREDLKGRNLTFTEIAKLVGERWQNLAQAEKEPYDTQVQLAKDKYNNDLAEYKKTAEYRKYNQYLQDFKAKYAHQSQDKEAAKRVKLSSGDTNSGTGPSSRTSRSRSGSGSEEAGSELSSSRLEHTKSRHISTPGSYRTSQDGSVASPQTHNHSRRSVERSPIFNASPLGASLGVPNRGGWGEEHCHLPPLSDIMDPRSILSNGTSSSGEGHGFPFPGSSRGSRSPGPASGPLRPQLKKEQSSSDGSSSGSSYGCPPTPIEGPLPIHALLSDKPSRGYDSLPLYSGAAPTARDTTPPSSTQTHGGPKPYTNGFIMSPAPGNPQSMPAMQPTANRFPNKAGAGTKPKSSFDGMSALLRAGELVDRQAR